MPKRHLLDEVDGFILTLMKNALTIGIQELQKRNVRTANIEIELMHHIKTALKEENQ